MIVDTSFQLGQSTNLLGGYDAKVTTPPLRPSQKPALYETQIKLKDPNYEAIWSWPTITFHETAEELVSALVQAKLRKESFEDESSEGGGVAEWPAGALMLKGLTAEEYQAAVQNLSSQLDLDLSTPDWSYSLVRQTRTVGTAVYKSYERGLFANIERTLRPDFYAALRKLEKLGPHSTDVTKDGASGYINFYNTYGSHFVSGIEAGDTLFQVFAYGPERFKKMVDDYADNEEFLSGPRSPSFVMYTVPQNGIYGYTAAAGTLRCTSGDPALAKSLEEGLWLDTEFSGYNSIFTPLVTSGGININLTLKMITVTWIELASLNAFAEYYRKLIWRRVFKGVMYAKYADGLGVAPYFPNNCPYDLEAVYKDSDPIDKDGLMSTLATPTVSKWQELADLSLMKLQFPELVKKFSTCANAIKFPPPTNSPDIEVPGSSTVSLLAHVFSAGVGRIPPNLKISESAFTEIRDRIFCGEFYGGLRISSTDGSQSVVVMHGLIFEYKDKVSSVVRDTRDSPPRDFLAERLTDIQFSLVSAESRLRFFLTGNCEDDQKGLELIQRYLLWLGNLGGSDQRYNDEVSTLQARALYLANVAVMGPGAGVPVPYLNYDAYGDVVSNVQNVLRTATDNLTNIQQQIRERMAEERLIDNLQILNENIIASGLLLLDYIAAQASYQGDIAGMFQSVIDDKEKGLELATQRAEELSASLEEQRNVVEEAVAAYKKVAEEYFQKQVIRAAYDIALNLFLVGFTFAAPAGSILALQTLGEKVQRIQKAVNVFDAIIKTYRAIEAIPDNPQNVVDTLQDLEEAGVEMPTSKDWDETQIQMDAILDGEGPDIKEKYALSAAYSILVLRGKALLECQDTIQEIASDLSTAKAQLNLSDEQKKRLEELKANFNVLPEDLDVDKVDLVGLTGQLTFFERQMLMTLAQTVVIQDMALQYEYIRPPTEIKSFTMLNLQLAIVNQSLSINQGLTVQPPPQDQECPIFYEVHGVRPESLINKQAYTFNIALNKREFASYNYVRVKQVDVEIGGIVSTQSGKYYTELTFDGYPFYDRGFDGEHLTFQTVSRTYTGLHDVSSSSHVPPLEKSAPTQEARMYLGTTGRSSSDNISLITPFSAWKISLPSTSSNEGIKFDDCPRGVTVRLIFHIFAQLKEDVTLPSEMFQRSRDLIISRGYGPKHLPIAPIVQSTDMPRQSLESHLPANALQHPTQSTAFHGGIFTRNVSETDVLKMMTGKSVCAGWDVIFAMTAQEVNEQLKLQYEDRQGVPEFMRETGYYSHESETSEGIPVKTELNFKFDAPKLEFLLNNSNSAQIFLPMIGGDYKYSLYLEDQWLLINHATIEVADGSYVQGDVPFSKFTGSVSNQDNICVKLNEGNFTIMNLEQSTSNEYLDSVLTKYFSSLKDGTEVYKFGTIDYQGISVLDSLKPTAFQFNVYHTSSDRDVLQIFIATTGHLEANLHHFLLEPIPTTHQCSLIINTKIFFGDILPFSLGGGGIGLKLQANVPSNNPNKDQMWSSTATSGTVPAPYPESLVGQKQEPVPHVGTKYIQYWVKVPGDTVYVYLNSMTFKAGDANSFWSVKENYDLKQASYDYLAGDRSRICTFTCPSWPNIHYRSETVLADISMHTSLPFKVTGTGQNQELEIVSTTSDVSLTTYLEPTDDCVCSSSDLQNEFADRLHKFLPPKMTALFNQKFNSVSIFALKNILFPAKNVLDMSKVFVPGDMVVFGNFTNAPEK